MKLINTDYFKYKDEDFYCEDMKLGTLAEVYGTPLYVYSKKFFVEKYKEFDEAFKDIDHAIHFAIKANSNLSILNIFKDLGASFDVNSEGELERVLKIGVPVDKIILTGVGKSEEEIKRGIALDLEIIKAESEEEIHLINRIANLQNKIARVAIRVNPEVDALTHPYISTGLAKNKFGVTVNEATKLFTTSFSNIKFTGIDMHIGSQITQLQPFVDAVVKLKEVYELVKKHGIKLEHFDIGGGIGIVYNDESVFTIQEYARALIPLFKQIDCKIIFEPGRYLSGNGGVLITKVQYVKNNGLKNFLITDSAVNDLMRPALYDAYHHIQPLKVTRKADFVSDIVGPICESGDYFARDREIQKVNANDLLAVLTTGAYGMVMASNYNARRRAAEVLVDGDSYKLIRSRETFEHLIYDELNFLKDE